ncbi:hypothetical protein DSO57_1007700 [Entomophthora muscae]|uniref:Uncharacterized protein n=1 Tax=Entomophthora muscae TaxID=34485 RepID=A0ACC2SWK0_9FUNG|nr:hypothetical protein DSO57_1007700 [Entomophthora muscae]
MSSYPHHFHVGTPEANPSLSEVLGAHNAQKFVRQPMALRTNSESYSVPILELCQTLSHSADSVLAVAASKTFLFAGAQSGVIKVWDRTTFLTVKILEGHTRCILCLILSPDQKLLFSGSGDGTVRVWDAESHCLKYVLRTSPHVGDILSLAYLPSANTIFLGCQDTSIQWFSLDHPSLEHLNSCPDAVAPSRLPKIEVPGLPPSKPFFPPVVVRKDCDEIEHRIPLQWVQHSAHLGYIYSLLIGPILDDSASQHLFSGSGDGSIKIWRIDFGASGVRLSHTRTLSGISTDTVYAMALREGLLYAGLQGGYVAVFDLETFQRIRTLLGHQDDVLALTCHQDDLYSADSQGLIKKWNRAFECVGTIQGHDGLVLTMTLAEESILISGGSDNCVRLWWLAPDRNLQKNIYPRSFKENDGGVDELLQVLEKWVRIPTISGQVHHMEDCRLGAKFLKNLLVQLGAEARLVQGAEGRNPLVYGVFRASTSPARRVLFYGHYDVVSARPKEWATDPFQLIGKDGYLYGRGVTDNKGPILAAVFATSELVREKKLGVEVTFLIEGEEESGSTGFFPAVQALRPELGEMDLILLSNSYWLNDEIPCITYGLRGVIHASIRVANQHADSHSGVYGGGIAEPLIDLTQLLAKLISQNKQVLIPGFYDKVRPTPPEEDAEFVEIARIVSRNAPHVSPSKLKSQWRCPTLTIHKIATSGPNDQTTVIPSWARADLSMRIVPDQSLDHIVDAFKAHVHSCFQELSSENEIEVNIHPTHLTF